MKRVQLCYTVLISDPRLFRKVGRKICRQAGVGPCDLHAMVNECLLSGRAPLDCGIEIQDHDLVKLGAFGGCSRRR